MRGVLVASFVVLFTQHLTAQIWLDQTRIDTTSIARNLSVAWDLEWWSEDTILFTEIDGDVKRVSIDGGSIDTLYTVPDLARESQAGLLGLQMHPDWPSTPKVFIAYTYYQGSNILLKVVELTYDRSNNTFIESGAVIMDIPSSNTNTGCRLLIASDGKMYITVGDVKDNSSPQDQSSLNGKVLRVNLDGSIPIDNPNTASVVFTYGHRNPQGITQTPNGKIFISEHGPSSDDELNELVSGSNYGWPLVTGPCNENNQGLCDSIGATDPLDAWTPTVAPCGIDVYDNTSIPEWSPGIVMANLKAEQLMVVKFTNNSFNEVEHSIGYFLGHFGRVRDVLVAENGELFISTSNTDIFGTPAANDDRILRLTPSQHNGVEDLKEEKVQVYFSEGELLFSEPANGIVSAYDVLGRSLFSQSVSNMSKLNLGSLNHHGLMLIELISSTSQSRHKLIVP